MWHANLFTSKQRRTLLQFFAGGIIAYSVVVLVYANLVPFIGIEVIGQRVGAVAIAEMPLWFESPRVGDSVVEVGGVAIDSWPHYLSAISHLREADRFPVSELSEDDVLPPAEAPSASVVQWKNQRFARFKFQRQDSDGQAATISTWLPVLDLPWQRSAISIAWFAMESLVFWMGWLVYRRRPDDDSAAMFFLLCIVTVGAYMGAYHWMQIASSPALIFVFAICAMAVPQISLHFYLLYPAPKQFLVNHPKTVLLLLYIVPAILQVTVLFAIGAVVSSFRHNLPVASIHEELDFLRTLLWSYLSVSGVILALGLASLIHSFATAREADIRSQAQWVLLGALLAGVVIIYGGWQIALDPAGFAMGGATWAIFAASLILTCAYAISIGRYRLLHVEEVIQRGVIYVLVSFAGGLVYWGLLLLAIWLSPRLASDRSHGHALLMSIFLILLLLGLGTIRSRLQKVLDRRFYREKHQLERAMHEMDEAVGKLVDRATVLRRCLVVATDMVDAGESAVYLRGGESEFVLEQEIGSRAFPPRFPANHELVRALEAGNLLQLNIGSVLLGDSCGPLLRRLGIEIALPFLLENRMVGFLLFARKEVGMYSSEDLDFLSGLTEMTRVALRSAETQQTLDQLNQDLRAKVDRISKQPRQLLPLPASLAVPVRAVEPTPRPADPGFARVRGSSTAVADLIETARKVASSQATVLIRGESGTGKGLLAEMIHENSPRAQGPFIKVHCAALSPTLLESELFGHVKGAFTGASSDKVGRFQRAHRGTLFLDEIGDIGLDIQTKLLRILQERTFEPVGSSDAVTVDVRIITATHQPLERLIQQGRIREDLFYRLNVISIRTPALRERRVDIPELASHFLGVYADRSGKSVSAIDDAAMEELMGHDWPGNIRELENVIERAVVLADGPTITIADLPAEIRSRETGRHGDVEPAPFDDWAASEVLDQRPAVSGLITELEEVERQRLLDALQAGRGNKARAARILGIPRTTLCSKLKRYGIA